MNKISANNKLTKNMADIKIIKKISYPDTIKALPVGESIKFKNADVRPGSIRRIVYALNNKGYLFRASEKGLINEIIVKRFK